MATHETHVIIGAGLAGAKAAETLREEGFTGRIALIGEETEPPYERPPLSKDYLLGTGDRSKVFVHDEGWYEQNSVELLLGRRAVNLDRAAREVQLDSGERIHYTKLLLANGVTARTLDMPGADLAGVRTLRRIDDSERLRETLRGGARVVVIGAGWIGLETAAAAREYGCEVTVLEPQAAPLLAALGPEMGGYFADLHRRHGVDLRLGRGVAEILGHAGRVTAVRTDEGAQIPADVVIIGVGARPNTDLAERAGLTVDNGVLVDQSLRTNDPDVYAAGDVANAFHPRYGRPIRVEHWANALHGGPAAARSMLGHPVSHNPLPYFFTDQYDVGMEFAGWFPPGEYDNVIVRGDPASSAFHALWLRADRVVAGMHINLWDDGIEPVKQLIDSDTAVDRNRLADRSVPLTVDAVGGA